MNAEDLIAQVTEARTEKTTLCWQVASAMNPQLAAAALAGAEVRALLNEVQASQQVPALLALSVIARTPNLVHNPGIPLGRALGSIYGDNHLEAMAASVTLAAPQAATLIGGAVARAARHGSMNLVEFVTLIAAWDTLTARERSAFLIELHRSRA